MDLSTTYLGFDLPHPLMPGASPLVDDLDTVRRLEDAGAAAIIMRSLFEEQLTGEQLATHHYAESPADSFAEALSYLPSPPDFVLGPDEYLEQVRGIKDAVGIPVIGSLNGSTPGGWVEFASLIVEAGADALELNVHEMPTDLDESGQHIEQRILDVFRSVDQAVDVPVAVKLSPFYTSPGRFARELDRAGAKGLILFNRFYQADIDPAQLEAVPTLHLSHPYELLLRLNWLAVISGRVDASLAVTGGVHSAVDAVKAIMAGAHAVQMVSALLEHGPEHLATVRQALADWLEEHEYDSIQKMQGSMNLLRCPDPRAFERGNYMRVLQSWQSFI